MAKNLLGTYTIGGDVIDRVPVIRDVPFAVPHNSGETTVSPESPKATEGLSAGTVSASMNESPPDFSAEKEGLFHVVKIGSTTYRIGGVKALFVTSLRVNLRASNGTYSYYDSLDLYMARARSGFALALQRTWGAEPSRVEKDLVALLEHLEAERDRELTSAKDKVKVEISEADKARGLELLSDPNLFGRITSDLSTLGYVGEDLNKMLLYLCASSRKLDDPISVLILSQSASGKSFLVDSVKKLMPPEEVVAVTSLSDQALNYIDDLSHKFLVLGEAVHGDVVEHQIREMLSGKELSRLVTIKDAETGKMQSKVMRTPVIVSSVMSGTNHTVNPENASRCFVVNTDESTAQTQAIHENQRLKYSLERLATGPNRVDDIIKTHRAAQRLLIKHKIVNDFAPHLDFPIGLMRLRRDHDRFLDLIACVCFLRQFQKQTAHHGDLSFIRCDLADYAIAYRIMVEGVLRSTVRELPPSTVALYGQIKTFAAAEAKRLNVEPQELTFSQRQIREYTGLSHTPVKVSLRQLVDYEYLNLARGGSERSKAFYRLRDGEGIQGADLSMIPSPEAMAKKVVAATKKV